jgi:hypothetical protein
VPVQKTLLEVRKDLRSQRRSVMTGDGGARQGQSRRGHFSLVVCARLSGPLKH